MFQARSRSGRGRAAGPIDVASTSQTLAAISDFRFALLLRDSYGWSLDHIEAWMADASRALLLD